MSIRDFHRVNVAQKTSYTYHTADGDITIRPSEETGVTIELIHMLHREDNRIVDQNIKQARRPMTEAERRDIEAWRNDDEHPERKRGDFPDKYQRWNLPIDGLRHDDDDDGADGPLDRDPILREAFTAQVSETPSEVERLRAFIATLSERQRQLYRLVYMDGYSLKEAALAMGITHQRASTIDKQIRNNIQKKFRR